jgi:hypothetical protein
VSAWRAPALAFDLEELLLGNVADPSDEDGAEPSRGDPSFDRAGAAPGRGSGLRDRQPRPGQA